MLGKTIENSSMLVAFQVHCSQPFRLSRKFQRFKKVNYI